MKMVRGRSRVGIKAAAEVLKRGGVVVFPTETVYGMGADAFNPRAVARIFAIKGRPAENPLIVHISSLSDVKKLAKEVPAAAKKLMRRFWPGPLTIILKKKKGVPSVVTGGLDTVAVRMPSHSVALAFLRAAKTPVAAPSANPSGSVSPVSHRDIMEDFPAKSISVRRRLPDALISAGRTSRGMESTIIDVASPELRILRHGSVTVEDIASALGTAPKVLLRGSCGAKRPLAPGMAKIHYRPRIPLWVFATAAVMKNILLAAKSPAAEPVKTFVIAPVGLEGVFRRGGFMVAAFRDAAALSKRLYSLMRKAARSGASVIAAPLVGGGGISLAVNDRLIRAASKTFR
ncbi:MAG: L-threonylcarbamoyladenylate synthase [Endomicrobiia bacterium]|nr:L-threonylcarbamoyladenylate synthase [Endomicrobiia bacterium]